MRRRWVLTSLTDVQVNKKADVAAVTLSLKSRKQPEPINQGNHQPTLVAISMTSHLRHQPNDRVDLPIMQISPPSPGQAPQPASAAPSAGSSPLNAFWPPPYESTSRWLPSPVPMVYRLAQERRRGETSAMLQRLQQLSPTHRVRCPNCHGFSPDLGHADFEIHMIVSFSSELFRLWACGAFRTL